MKARGEPIYCTADYHLALDFMALAFKLGYSPGLSSQENMWFVRVSKAKYASFNSKTVSRVKYTGKVFCITTYTGNFIAFQGKRMFVTGNSWYAMDSKMLEQAKNVDVFLTPSGGMVENYRDMGINAHYLPEAADPESHFPAKAVLEAQQKHYGSSVSFVGTVLGVVDRALWLKRIGERFNDLKVWGSFPDPMIAPWHTGIRADGDAAHNLVVSCSKVMLDYTRTPDIEGAISARVYRTLAAKGFLLMRHVKGLERQFIPGQHLETFRTTEECLERIERYLQDPERRERIAASGYEKVLRNHTWDQRVKLLVELV